MINLNLKSDIWSHSYGGMLMPDIRFKMSQ